MQTRLILLAWYERCERLVQGHSSPSVVRWPRKCRGSVQAWDLLHRGMGCHGKCREGRPFTRLSADQGNKVAQFNLGCFYASGEGVVKDLIEACRFFRLSADQGDASAQYNLGLSYEFGRGITKNMAEAIHLYTLSSNQGDVDAQLKLAYCYRHGRGVEQDMLTALDLCHLSSDKGHARGQLDLGSCYHRGDGVDEDPVEAARLWRLSADQGNSRAQCLLGERYLYGDGVVKDEVEAVRLFRLSADQGEGIGLFNLADLYRKGMGVAKDFTEAARLYRLAANQGHQGSQIKLGSLYFHGQGVERNCDTALYWLKRTNYTNYKIGNIERRANKLVKKSTTEQRRRIASGDSVNGTTTGTGYNVLHVASRHLRVETVALLFDHPSFDDLLLRVCDHNILPRDVVGVAVQSNTRMKNAMCSVLSVSRRTRAACILWCFKIIQQDSPHLLTASIPIDLVREILTSGVLPSPASGSLDTDSLTLFRSPSAWPRPCLALRPTWVPHVEGDTKSLKRSHSRVEEEDGASDEPTLKRNRQGED